MKPAGRHPPVFAMGYNQQHYGTAGFYYLHTVPDSLARGRFFVF